MAKRNKTEYDALMSQYKKLAKRADQRLVRLENMAQQPGFRSVLKYAYKKAMRSIRTWSGENATRFNTKAPSRIDQLRSKIRDIENFLSKVSSKVGGIKSVYKKRAQTINKKFGTNFSWEDLGKFFESPEFEKYGSEDAKNGFGSDTYMLAIGVMQDNEKDFVNALKNNQPVNIDVENEKVREAVDTLLNDYGVDFKKLYK